MSSKAARTVGTDPVVYSRPSQRSQHDVPSAPTTCCTYVPWHRWWPAHITRHRTSCSQGGSTTIALLHPRRDPATSAHSSSLFITQPAPPQENNAHNEHPQHQHTILVEPSPRAKHTVTCYAMHRLTTRLARRTLHRPLQSHTSCFPRQNHTSCHPRHAATVALSGESSTTRLANLTTFALPTCTLLGCTTSGCPYGEEAVTCSKPEEGRHRHTPHSRWPDQTCARPYLEDGRRLAVPAAHTAHTRTVVGHCHKKGERDSASPRNESRGENPRSGEGEGGGEHGAVGVLLSPQHGGSKAGIRWRGRVLVTGLGHPEYPEKASQEAGGVTRNSAY